MTKTPDFLELLHEAQWRGRKHGHPPITLRDLAGRCGTTRQHLYNLVAGKHVPRAWTEEQLAKGLGFSLLTVRAALARSRGQAVVA